MSRREGNRWLVKPGVRPDLAKIDTASTAGAPSADKVETKVASEILRAQLAALQGRLYAESRQSLLVVVQAMDAGGKDGTIRSVFAGVNPQGVNVTSFKVPTEIERAHDFLWRVHAHTPAHGDVAIFNRSHYEDVLVARVHGTVPKSVWTQRFRHIKAFEAGLIAANTHIVKFMLHVSREEQRRRLQERVDTPEKRWKFNAADLAERDLWDEYQTAFADAIAKTSTRDAPWYVIPADRNWYRDWAVLHVLVDKLREMDPQYPGPAKGVAGLIVPK